MMSSNMYTFSWMDNFSEFTVYHHTSYWVEARSCIVACLLISSFCTWNKCMEYQLGPGDLELSLYLVVFIYATSNNYVKETLLKPCIKEDMENIYKLILAALLICNPISSSLIASAHLYVKRILFSEDLCSLNLTFSLRLLGTEMGMGGEVTSNHWFWFYTKYR